MKTTLTIMFEKHSAFTKMFGVNESIIVEDPQHIPRVGDSIDLGIASPITTRVTQVLWKYQTVGKQTTTRPYLTTHITCLVD